MRNAVVQILSRPSQIPPSSNRHRQIIKKLQSYKSLIFIKADKGSHTVVLDRSDYLSKMTDILQDNTTFSSISPQENLALTKSFRKALCEMKKSSIITPDQFALFTSCLDREAYIYGLPKIHKPGVPLRPIIAYHLSQAYSVAKFLVSFLFPLMKDHPNTYSITHPPSFIEDLLNLQPPPLHSMVSFDVTSLYLSLPHSLIADKLQSFLITNNIDTQTASHVLQLASLCLSICTFTFNKQFYKQTRGTPMGSPLSSIISEIVMGSLDTWINQALPSDIYYWRRYVDDIFCIIKTDSLQLTYSTLHDFNPHIKFTYETEIDSVLPFLDILIIRTPQSFHTSVFHKKHIPPQYTHFSSNSPISFKINTVRTLTKRMFTHCSLPIFKTIERSRIHSLLTTAGYPIDFIEKHTFDPRVHRTTTIHRATCWLPFSPAAVSISRVLRPYGIKVLYNSPPNLATILRHHITKSDKPTLPINSTGAVYSIQCLDCPTSYVGETGRTTGIRISEHRRNIRNKDPKSLIFTHIAQTGHIFDLDHPQSFLGAVNVYNKFIPDYARLRAPLNKLLKKDTKWQWDNKLQQAFTALKERLTRKPVLHLYQDGLPCRLYCDAFTQGIAGILKQVHPDGKIHSTQYYNTSVAVDVNGLHTIRRKGVNRIIIPEALQHSLMNQVHSEYNHPGISQMTRLISTQYYWKGMVKSIQKFVNSCHTCQIIKRPKDKPYGTLGQIPPPQQPFDLISIDTISGFSKYGHSKTYLHVIVDHLTRYAWAFPSKSTSTLTYIQTLKKVLQQGSPKRLLSDRAPAFTSEKFRKFLLSRGIQPLLTTSNNPQANGLIERLNATITGKLRLLYLENPKTSWTKLIKQVVQIYNQSPHTVTGFPSIFLMFNSIPPELKNHYNPFPDVQKARQLASSRTQLKHERDKQRYDKGHQAPHFEIGDLVLVKNYKHPDTGKLAPYFTAPYCSLAGPAPYCSLAGPAPYCSLAGPAPYCSLAGPAPYCSLSPRFNSLTLQCSHWLTIVSWRLLIGSSLVLLDSDWRQLQIPSTPANSLLQLRISPTTAIARFHATSFPSIANHLPKSNPASIILSKLNSYHLDLNFTYEKETNNSLPFLDVKIMRIENKFQTTVQYKPSFNPDYIRLSSYCPLSHKINTVKTLTKRVHSHCSLQTFKTEETQNILRNIKTCQYPLSFILRHFHSPSEMRNPPVYKSICSIPYSPDECRDELIRCSRCGLNVQSGFRRECIARKNETCWMYHRDGERVMPTPVRADLKLAEFPLKMILVKDAQKFQRTDENVQKITDLIKENPRTTLLELEQDTGISKTTIGRIDMLEMTRTDPEWKDKIITGYETWVIGYHPETKHQSAEWRCQGKRFEKKRPEKWTNGGWILHHDNARPHTAHLMTSFLAKNGTQILLQPPYFPDIAPNDFFLFPKLKAVLKGRHFDTRDDIIEKSPLALKSIPKEAYKNCFDNWEKRWRWLVHFDYPKRRATCGYPGPGLIIDGQVEYSWREDYAVYLVGLARSGILLAATTEQKYHRGGLLKTIDTFEPSIARKTAAIRQ
ncbi:hypothetical protein LAZ67_4003150 [Cordylochernes scorpioides]|uniref:Uncharacterized protein n=1 Tax=Cordylochernes scorpioides TaxID=51811 RepID=A0ABY6KDG9_9ARAC|nr:hypothetical protein LAZ67_4003150 [Cordylochernes scorpioides]